MSTTAMLHVRMDEDLKAKATAALDAMGLSASDAVRMFFKRIVAEQAFPLELKVPNAETRAAMRESEEILAAHRKRWEAEIEGVAESPATPDRPLEPGDPNAETLAAMRESEEIVAARQKRWESEG